MKAITRLLQKPVEATVTWKKIKKSAKVAEWYWNVTFVFFFLAGCGESVMLTMVSVALLASATLHRLNVERRK